MADQPSRMMWRCVDVLQREGRRYINSALWLLESGNYQVQLEFQELAVRGKQAKRTGKARGQTPNQHKGEE